MKKHIIYFSGLVIISSFIFSDSTNVEKDNEAADIKKNKKTTCMYQQNKQCIKELDIKWQEIEKLIKEKINNNK